MKLDIMSRKKALFAVFEDFCHAPLWCKGVKSVLFKFAWLTIITESVAANNFMYYINTLKGQDRFIIILVAISFFLVAETAKAQIYQTMSISITGSINDTQFTMYGATVFSGSTPPSHYKSTLKFSNLPSGFPTPLSFCCWWTKFVSLPESNAVNLTQVSGGNYHVHRQATYRDPLGKVIGQLTVEGDFNKTSTNTSTFTATINGNYTGPTNIV
jgi:hypothetical protein